MQKHVPYKIISAVDIGTTKICVLIAQLNQYGDIEILGVGQQVSSGMKKGIVVNIARTVEALKKAIRQAEKMAGVAIDSVVAGISGGHVSSFNSKGVVAIRKSDVTQHDIDRVIDAAQAVAIPQDREILHVLPQYFRVDSQDSIQDSLGMYGVRLEAQVHIITGAVNSAQNIIKSCELAGVRVSDIVLEQLASADAVLTESERELGVGILDIGGGTSDFAIYKDGRICYSKVFPVAGKHFTNDLAIGSGIAIVKAEELKRAHGFVMEERYLDLAADSIEVEVGIGDKRKQIDTYSLFDILNPRAEEIFMLVRNEIIQHRLKSLMSAGLVLTGGGSLLQGMRELGQDCLYMPVRIGIPICPDAKNSVMPDLLKSPMYSTSYGLLVYTVRQGDLSLITGGNEPMVQRVFKRMKSWIHDFI